MLVRLRLLFVIVVVLIVAGAMLLLSGSLASAAPNPPGNNGTVKVDAEPFDDHPDNEPHVGCAFQIDFYGFDEGELNAEVTFAAHPSTQRPGGVSQVLLSDEVFIGEDDNAGGGSQAGLDASATYTLDLAGISPHPVQGFHVKLTVHADGSQGADTKHKVFWVTGCGPGTTTTTSGGTTTSGPTTTSHDTSTSSTGGPTTSAPSSSAGGSSSSTPGSSASGLSSSQTGGGGLAGTGANAVPLLAVGLSILGLGTATLLAARRRRRTWMAR